MSVQKRQQSNYTNGKWKCSNFDEI